MQISQICLFQLMIEGPVYAAAFQSRPQKERKPYLFSLFSLEEHFVMIGIHTLVRMSVHIQQGFKSAVISSSGLAEVKQTTTCSLLSHREALLPFQPTDNGLFQ